MKGHMYLSQGQPLRYWSGLVAVLAVQRVILLDMEDLLDPAVQRFGAAARPAYVDVSSKSQPASPAARAALAASSWLRMLCCSTSTSEPLRLPLGLRRLHLFTKPGSQPYTRQLELVCQLGCLQELILHYERPTALAIPSSLPWPAALQTLKLSLDFYFVPQGFSLDLAGLRSFQGQLTMALTMAEGAEALQRLPIWAALVGLHLVRLTALMFYVEEQEHQLVGDIVAGTACMDYYGTAGFPPVPQCAGLRLVLRMHSDAASCMQVHWAPVEAALERGCVICIEVEEDVQAVCFEGCGGAMPALVEPAHSPLPGSALVLDASTRGLVHGLPLHLFKEWEDGALLWRTGAPLEDWQLHLADKQDMYSY